MKLFFAILVAASIAVGIFVASAVTMVSSVEAAIIWGIALSMVAGIAWSIGTIVDHIDERRK